GRTPGRPKPRVYFGTPEVARPSHSDYWPYGTRREQAEGGRRRPSAAGRPAPPSTDRGGANRWRLGRPSDSRSRRGRRERAPKPDRNSRSSPPAAHRNMPP